MCIFLKGYVTVWGIGMFISLFEKKNYKIYKSIYIDKIFMHRRIISWEKGILNEIGKEKVCEI